MQQEESKTPPPRAILVAVDCGDFVYDAEASLAELQELLQTAGYEPGPSVIQRRESPDKATCIGAGRLEEIGQLCFTEEADTVVFDRELTPTQLRNLEKQLKICVMDRTMLILEIFASRAQSSEGKLQVELAQLQYMLPRLTGQGTALSRIGGGPGTHTRGSGETQLETDRRHIRRRIESLKQKLSESNKRRQNMRHRRKKNNVPTVALVGYTNAGKSTLMNALTQAGVLAEDRLFATLDPTARSLRLPSGRHVVLIDTVGLVRNLPHHLVEAFRSTLEEAAEADLILNLCDASSPEASVHLEVTKDLLESLNCGETPILSVFNKCDLLTDASHLPHVGKFVCVSARLGSGMDQLLDAIDRSLPQVHRRMKLLIPFEKAGLAARIRRNGSILEERYLPEGLLIRAIVDQQLLQDVRPFVVD